MKCNKGHDRVNDKRGRCIYCERESKRTSTSRTRERLGTEGLKARRRKAYLRGREKELAAMRRYRKAKPEKVKALKKAWAERPDVKARYRRYSREFRRRAIGWTPEAFAEVWAKQKGLCAICKLVLTDGEGRCKTSACADHCHATLKTRGILCFRCNVGLGSFQDDEQLLRNAIKYLKKHPTKDKKDT